MKNNTLLIAKNDFEGIATAIFLNVILKQKIDIKFYRYEIDSEEIETEEYNYIISIGLKNVENIDTKYKTLTIFNSFAEVVDYFKADNEDVYKKHKLLDTFCKHAEAYLNWTWKDDKLYYGKNIDELSKYFNKADLVRNITDKIINNKEIINNMERQMIIFSKKIMTNYIERKNYSVVEDNGIKLAYTFCEVNEIELANKIIENENVDAVVLANLNNRIIRIKTNKKSNNFANEISQLKCHTNSNGGTLKISDNTYDKIHRLVFDDILNTLRGGTINECEM